MKDYINKIPGFRTGRKWKMIVAMIIYLIFFLLLVSSTGVTLRDRVVAFFNLLIIFGIPFILIFNLGNIRNKLPLFNKKTMKSTISGALVTMVIMSIGISMLDNLKSSEQKQLDLLSVQQAKEQEQVMSEARNEALNLDERITLLGDIESLKSDDAQDVISIRKDYELLTEEQKELVTKIELLESAEKKMIDFKKEVAFSLDNKIALLGKIESLTYDNVDDVGSLRKDYELLTTEQKGFVTNLKLLESAEMKMLDIMTEVALSLDEKIKSLGSVDSLTYDKAEIVNSIKEDFESLTTEQKELVTNRDNFELAVIKISELKIVAEKAAAEKAAADKAAAEKKAAEIRAAAEKKAAEEQAAEDYQNWINNQFSFWDGSHKQLVKLVEENLNDPKSFEHVETVYWDKGTYLIVKMTYRAKNGFGALILQNVTANADYATDYISIVSQND